MQTRGSSSEQPNVPMCRFVCELLPPTRQGLLRSAGSVGYNAFEELVELGDVPVYVEVVTDGGDVARFGALMNAPIRGVKKPKRRKPKRQVPEEHVIVFWEGAMRRRGMADPSWPHLPWKCIRYHCDPQHPRGRCLPNNLMSGSCAAQIEVVCEGVEALQATPLGYLSYCDKLQHVDLSCFKNVTVISDSLMLGCGFKSTMKVDLSPFTNVHTVGHNMLFSCSIDSIDLTPLRNVTQIKANFLSQSYKLTSIDLSPLVNLKSIGACFMARCICLTSIDLTPLASVTTIDSHFLAHCTGLTHVDLRPLKGVSSLGHALLQGCKGMLSVSLPTFDHIDDTIGPFFLSDCASLQEINLSPLHSMTTLPSYFLQGCTSLTNINLTPLSRVTVRDELDTGLEYLNPHGSGNFLLGCTGITHLDMSPMVLLSKEEKQQSVLNEFSGRVTWGTSTSSEEGDGGGWRVGGCFMM